jgi:hypothetical protein
VSKYLRGVGVEGEEVCPIAKDGSANCGRIVLHVTSVAVSSVAGVGASHLSATVSSGGGPGAGPLRSTVLCVRARRGVGLPSRDLLGKQDPYVTWTVLGSGGDAVVSGTSTVVRKGGAAPVWPDTDRTRLCFEAGSEGALRLRADVLDEDKGALRDDVIGFGYVEVAPPPRSGAPLPSPPTTLQLQLLQSASGGTTVPIVGSSLEFDTWFDVVRGGRGGVDGMWAVVGWMGWGGGRLWALPSCRALPPSHISPPSIPQHVAQVSPADEAVIVEARRARAKAVPDAALASAIVAGKPSTAAPQAPSAVWGTLWLHVLRGDHLRYNVPMAGCPW